MGLLDVIREIPQFDTRPELRVERLDGGSSNDNFLISSGAESWVLRRGNALVAGTLPTEDEYRIMQVAADAGLAPRPIFCDSGRRLLLSEYLPFPSWGGAEVRRLENLERLALRMKILHSLEVAAPAYAPMAAIRAHLECTLTRSGDTRYVAALRGEIESLEKRLGQSEFRPCLCHNDLIAGNIIDCGELVFVDWEFAGLGDPCFDLAMVASLNALTGIETQHLLDSYGASPSGAARERFAANRRLADCVNLSWALTRMADGAESARIEQIEQQSLRALGW